MRNPNVTALSFILGFARTYLKKDGFIENSTRGVWALTAKGSRHKKVEDIPAFIERVEKKMSEKEEKELTAIQEEDVWKTELLDVIKNIKPSAFEQLCKRLLRELGFENVEVTGKPGDGGIDGKGILKVGPVITFRVYFQCKRHKGSVSPAAVRNFRGAIGQMDKGIIITTGKFTTKACEEAQRDGIIDIDLMDGDKLAEHLKDTRLGVKVDTENGEKVSIEKEWFNRFNTA